MSKPSVLSKDPRPFDFDHGSITREGTGITLEGLVKDANDIHESAKEWTETGSDGYHTFAELYNHRHALALTVAKLLPLHSWAARYHEDGTMFEDMFILGIELRPGETISYHLPMKLWTHAESVVGSVLERAPAWDGHTPDDVVDRLHAFLLG